MKSALITIIVGFMLIFSTGLAQPPDWLWAKRTAGSSYDVGQSIAVDNLGNSYVTGHFESAALTFGTTTLLNASNWDDIFVVKFDASGNVIWARRYGGSRHDQGLGIAVDNSGNSYVTGYYESSSIKFSTTMFTNPGGHSIFVVKLDPMGNVVWAKRPGGTGFGNSIAADNSGNSYVTGYYTSPTITFGSTTLTNTSSSNVADVFVVKYDAGGNIVWAKNGGGSNHDFARGIAIDNGGNVWVTGDYQSVTVSFGAIALANANTPTSDIFVVKYDPSGNVIQAHSANGISEDWPSGIALDNSGNAYIAGSFDSPVLSFSTTTLTKVDGNSIFLLKCDNDMNPIWAVSAGGDPSDGAAGIIVDNSGNCWMVGTFGSPTITFGSTTLTRTGYSDVFIAEFDAGGNAISAVGATTDNNLSLGAAGMSIGVDNLGSCFITGYFASPTVTFGDITLTRSGYYSNVFVAKCGVDTTAPDTCSIWTKILNSTIFKNSPANKTDNMGFKIPTDAKFMTRNLAVDADGNSYIAGYSNGGTAMMDYITVKYNFAGAEVWSERFDGAGSKDDKAYALTIDLSGNVYVTGESNGGAASGVNIVTLKYNAWGSLVGQASYTSTGVNKDIGYALALSPDGTILYVAGETFGGSTTNIDYVVVAYNTSNLGQLWAETWNGVGNGTDKAYAAVADDYGVVVTGESFGGLITKTDYATIRYSSSGTLLWSNIYNGDGKNDFAFAVKTDAAGNAYVTGASDGVTTKFDYATLKYNLSGQQQWVAVYNNIKNDMAYDLAVDDSGNVYVTGASEGNIGGKNSYFDYATIKYNLAGVQQWVNRIDGGIKKKDIARSIALCKDLDAVFVTGSSDQGLGRKLDYYTLRLSMVTGITQWTGRYNGSALKDDIAYNIAVRPGNCCLLLSGSSVGLSTGLDFVTITGPSDKAIPGSITSPAIYDGECQEEEGNIIVFALEQNYPNPFNPNTMIQFALPEQSFVTLKIYNMLGQEVERLLDCELMEDGTQDVEFDATHLASGIYFYRLIAQGIWGEDKGTVGKAYTSVKKMLLLK